MKKLKSTGDKLIPVFFALGLLILWQLVVSIGGIEKYILPAPSDVIKVIIKDFNVMLPHILITLYEGIVGFILSTVAALILAIIMDMSALVKKALYPLFVISQTIPIIALAPLFIIWFGFGTLPKIIVVILVCFFPIVISISDGLESVDKDFINHFKLMGASRIKVFLHLKLPYGILSFFSGMRIAATYSIMGAVVGEWLGGDKGIGVYMTRARSAYALDKMFAAIIIIVVVSMGIFILVTFIEKILTPWKRVQE
ncbi:ABC transporter permease [Clostridium saccharobutylicum]|uniref:ABC transporter permease protein n=1 Tax=Clostridium saccharobutylicum DSM 13864 TaxID=1345695 RepID=U5MSF6_CLOSA|nr:ABC transporter permease [Clostridium saccharobutylicum]AGX43428.1 ABC transporter permease protein [Clostridium saccharobutylicum DSM 13864]AQR90727.1 putative aliphatic sulfonates transport permease protein SsuC [Clostridium saccharobutylicum]AQS00631.1 putative aliphatic sulfonates transport permease protein SsuC [Clostridium saccharobutylicum]AQS14614.1 putative aliphatic sulfonates transport permease protein SsuC [Clostridium saccharobutylicum]MBA2907229.1 ABC-type nitrate/sulfonate/bi